MFNEKTESKIIRELITFAAYAASQNNEEYRDDYILSFNDVDSFLAKEEPYKDNVYILARDELKCQTWTEADIGSGKISAFLNRVINCKDNNLVNYNQKTHFRNVLMDNTTKYKAEKALYNLYKGNTLTGILKR
jgi:hypothetical protein